MIKKTIDEKQNEIIKKLQDSQETLANNLKHVELQKRRILPQNPSNEDTSSSEASPVMPHTFNAYMRLFNSYKERKDNEGWEGAIEYINSADMILYLKDLDNHR